MKHCNSDLLLVRIAQYALHEELLTEPKPGLVSHIDNGSHYDMDYTTFRMSINILGEYFTEIVKLAIHNHEFGQLKQLALRAEARMLIATNQVNTHRGSIFVLGIILAATTYCLQQKWSYNQISQVIKMLYSKGLSEHQVNLNSHGSKIRQQYNLESIIKSAILGFPLVFSSVVKFREYQCIYSYMDAKLFTFFYIMCHLDDTNLVHRGGIDGLYFARMSAKEGLSIKNLIKFRKYAYKLHQQFIIKNLSPGGCADILAATIFLDKAYNLWV